MNIKEKMKRINDAFLYAKDFTWDKCFMETELIYNKFIQEISSISPFFSVIISTLNSECSLESTILSFLGQEYGGKELIIVDGGSTDKTIEIIRKYNSHISFWVSENDDGIYDAWNKGLVIAKGNWISFIGSGDRFLPNALFYYSKYIQSFPQKEYISSKVIITDNSQKILSVIGNAWSWNKFKSFMNCAHVGSMHSTRLFEKYGKFNTFYKIAGDYELLLRAKKRLNAGFLSIPTASMLTGGISNRNLSVFKETYFAKKLHTGRNILILLVELYINIIKFKIKKSIF